VVRQKQGDQMIGKMAKFMEKVAKTVAEPKNAKISISKLILKVNIIFETLKYLQKPCFETAYLGKNVKSCPKSAILAYFKILK